MYLVPDEISDATTHLYHHHRCWMTYSMLVPLEYKIIEQAPSDPDAFFACTYLNVVAVSSWFAARLASKPKQMAYVLAHEIGHQQMQHHIVHAKWQRDGHVTGRLRGDDPPVTYPYVDWIAQHAFDFQINDGLSRTGLEPPSEALINPAVGTFFDIEEDIYVRYYKDRCGDNEFDNRSPQRPGGSGSIGCGAPDVLPDPRPDDRFDADQRRANAFEKMVAAIDEAKMVGSSPGNWQRLFKRKHVAAMPWHEIIRLSVETSLGGPKSTWNKINKPAFAMGYTLPGNMRRAAGVVAVVIDTSASMSADEIATCIEHLTGLFTRCLPRELHVLETDTKVDRHVVLTNPRQLRDYVEPMFAGKSGLTGGGGTRLVAAHEFLIKEDIHPDVTIYFTDMGTLFPSNLGNSKKVFWVSTVGYLEAPPQAGITLRMNMN